MALGSNQVWGKMKGYFYSDLHSDKVRMQRIKLVDATVGDITKAEDYGVTVPGTVLFTTAENHNLSTSDYIQIYGTTSYDAVYQITKVAAKTFYVTATWVATETGVLYTPYATGGLSYDVLANFDFAANNADVILDPDATYQYVYDKANGKVMYLVTATSAEAANRAGVGQHVIYGTLIGKN